VRAWASRSAWSGLLACCLWADQRFHSMDKIYCVGVRPPRDTPLRGTGEGVEMRLVTCVDVQAGSPAEPASVTPVDSASSTARLEGALTAASTGMPASGLLDQLEGGPARHLEHGVRERQPPFTQGPANYLVHRVVPAHVLPEAQQLRTAVVVNPEQSGSVHSPGHLEDACASRSQSGREASVSTGTVSRSAAGLKCEDLGRIQWSPCRRSRTSWTCRCAARCPAGTSGRSWASTTLNVWTRFRPRRRRT
jgi:hypothetical protein